MFRTRTALLATVVAGGLLAALAVPASAGDVAAPNGSVVGDWKTRDAGFLQTVTFDSDGKVYGDAGCNRFTGGYTVKGSKIMIGPLASTLKFCDGRMDGEAAFLKKLQDAKTYKATDTRLRLYSSTTTLTLKAA